MGEIKAALPMAQQTQIKVGQGETVVLARRTPAIPQAFRATKMEAVGAAMEMPTRLRPRTTPATAPRHQEAATRARVSTGTLLLLPLRTRAEVVLLPKAEAIPLPRVRVMAGAVEAERFAASEVNVANGNRR